MVDFAYYVPAMSLSAGWILPLVFGHPHCQLALSRHGEENLRRGYPLRPGRPSRPTPFVALSSRAPRTGYAGGDSLGFTPGTQTGPPAPASAKRSPSSWLLSNLLPISRFAARA